MTREQLRAARALLNLRQDQLADLAEVGVATLRRFEGGREVGSSCLDALRRAVEGAGVILLDPEDLSGPSARGAGVVLKGDRRPAPPSGDGHLG